MGPDKKTEGADFEKAVQDLFAPGAKEDEEKETEEEEDGEAQ